MQSGPQLNVLTKTFPNCAPHDDNGYNSEAWDSPDEEWDLIADYYGVDENDPENSQDLARTFAHAVYHEEVRERRPATPYPEPQAAEDNKDQDAQPREPIDPLTPLCSDDEELPPVAEPQRVSNRNQHGDKDDLERRYDVMDSRNKRHGLIHWSFCFHQGCHVHFSEKNNSTWQPKEPKSLACRVLLWGLCEDDKCASHLIDKRTEQEFPGHYFYPFWNPEHDTTCTAKLASKPECWQLCLQDGCLQHRQQKIDFGLIKPTAQLNNIQIQQTNRIYDTYMAIEITFRTGGKAVALLDTGAMANYISRPAANRLALRTQRKRESYKLQIASGEAMPGIGRIQYETTPQRIAIQQHHETIQFDILEMATHDIILGIPWLEQQNPIVNWKTRQLRFPDGSVARAWKPAASKFRMADESMRHDRRGFYLMPSSTPRQASSLCTDVESQPGQQDKTTISGKDGKPSIPSEYQQWTYLFEEGEKKDALPKHEPWDHKIPLVEGKQPTFGPIYQLSEKELQVLKEYLEDNLAKGFIRPSTSSAAYPILFVPKKNGKLRLCVDYRKLNDITIKNRYPLPNANELRDRIAKATIFTTLDLRGAYNLIRMAPGEEWKTAFRTRYGLYEYLVMPFGLTNAPASCQELINRVLRHVLDQCAVAYLDDILIYSKTEAQHVEDVKKVLTALASVNLKLEPEKCNFHQQKVTFLGYILSTEGVQIDPEKVRAILDYPEPKDVKELQAFLGTINFNRRFIQGFSQIAAPLTSLTKKDLPYEWKKEQQESFDKLKLACTKTPALRTFESGKDIRIETDASDTAIGACLLQMHDAKWHPVAYHSRKMTTQEQNYDIHDKELLAVVDAFKVWRVYAEGAAEIDVFTDHKNLIYFTTTKQLNRRQTRWSEELGQHKFKIIYTPGKDNQTADGLSRRPDLYEEKHVENRAILKMDNQRNLVPNQLNVLTIMETSDKAEKKLQELREACEKDPFAQQKLRAGETHPLKWNNRYLVPKALHENVIRDYHDPPAYGHPGVKRTKELINRTYDSPYLKQSIEDYIRSCPQCKMNKAENHAKYGYLQKIELPKFPHQSITMDFITDLPASMEPSTEHVYDAIMVVVDRHSKYVTLIPFDKQWDAVKLAYVFLDRVVREKGFPKEVISDRDRLFTSGYWKTMVASSGIKLKLSTAYHPETDGQTERTNRTLKEYLRHYATYSQSNWVRGLPIAQLAMNNLISSATGTTPFFANHGRNPNMMDSPLDSPNTAKAIEYNTQLEKVHYEIYEKLEEGFSRMETQANKTRKNGPQLQEGDKVWLHTKNLKTKRPSKKLDHVKVGPFLIKRVRGPVNYELQLPEGSKVHPVFHISLLEKADAKIPLATTFEYEAQEDEEYEVEKILRKQTNQYLIKWKGYPESENTWEPKENLLPNSAKMLREFEASESAAIARRALPLSGSQSPQTRGRRQ